MTTKQYRKTERLAVECENSDRRYDSRNYKGRDEWQDILDEYRADRDSCVSTYELKRFQKYLRLILADSYHREELYDKLLDELIEEEINQQQEPEIAESMDKEIEINDEQ